MTVIEKMREFIQSYPNYDIISQFHLDYTDQIPVNGGLFPSGLVELSRTKDIHGNATVRNQYNFALYTVFYKPPGDDTEATQNAEWQMDFQEWIQEQSATGKAPVFGDDPKQEVIRAQNGVLYSAEDEGTAVYMIQISVQFTKRMEVDNPWLI